MTRKTRHEYVPPVPEEELSWRMGSSAGRRLEARLREQGWAVRVADSVVAEPTP